MECTGNKTSQAKSTGLDRKGAERSKDLLLKEISAEKVPTSMQKEMCFKESSKEGTEMELAHTKVKAWS